MPYQTPHSLTLKYHNYFRIIKLCRKSVFLTKEKNNPKKGQHVTDLTSPKCDGFSEPNPKCDGFLKSNPKCDGLSESNPECDGYLTSPKCDGFLKSNPKCDGFELTQMWRIFRNPTPNVTDFFKCKRDGFSESNPKCDGFDLTKM